MTQTETGGQRFRVVQLQASNIRRLKAVDVKPPRSGAVIVAGNNGHGKTSLLDAIMIGLAGTDAKNEQAIRQGQDKAEITIDMGEFIAHRVIKPNRQTLELKTREGHTVNRPREFLDGIIGNLSFDPLEFTRMHPTQRIAMLMEMAGLEEKLAEIQLKRDNLFEERTGVNRALRDAEGELRSVEKPEEGAPTEKVDVQPLLEEQKRRLAIQNDNREKRRELSESEGRCSGLADEVERYRMAMEAAQDELKKEANRAAVLKNQCDTLNDPDLTEIDAQIVQAQHTNETVNKVRQFQAAVDRAAKLHDEANEKTATINALHFEKAELLANAEFPIPGLSFDGKDVLLNNIHFNQLSSAETLRVSLAMAMAVNPKLRVIRITDGSLLDDESMGIVCEEAAAKDYQVWIECVGNRDDAAVIIEDGAIKQKAEAVDERQD